MFVAERFLSNIVKEYGERPVSTDGSSWYHHKNVPFYLYTQYIVLLIQRHKFIWRKSRKFLGSGGVVWLSISPSQGDDPGFKSRPEQYLVFQDSAVH